MSDPRPSELCAHRYARLMEAGQPTEMPGHERRSLWEYYDRRVTQRLPGIANAHAYWTGLGVQVSIEDIVTDAHQLERRLRELAPTRFVDVGAGPGSFTGFLPGSGLALDQSRRALESLRALVPNVPVVRADGLHLPLANRSVDRFFAAHLYGLLLPEDRRTLLAEARRVAHEVLILDAGRPEGVQAAEWQERILPDGTQYQVFRRHFDAETLAARSEAMSSSTGPSTCSSPSLSDHFSTGRDPLELSQTVGPRAVIEPVDRQHWGKVFDDRCPLSSNSGMVTGSKSFRQCVSCGAVG